LQLTGLRLDGRGVNIQVLLFGKDWNSKSMAYLMLWIFTIQSLHKKNGIH
jgi:hypothetical protein